MFWLPYIQFMVSGFDTGEVLVNVRRIQLVKRLIKDPLFCYSVVTVYYTLTFQCKRLGW